MDDYPIKWKSGKADEPWKVVICARDAERARDLLQGVAYIVGGAMNRTDEDCADLLSQLSGAQIVKALQDYRQSRLASVEMALYGAARETGEQRDERSGCV